MPEIHLGIARLVGAFAFSVVMSWLCEEAHTQPVPLGSLDLPLRVPLVGGLLIPRVHFFVSISRMVRGLERGLDPLEAQ